MNLWFYEEMNRAWKLGLKVERHLVSHVSPFQKIEILETSLLGRMLVLDGKVQLTEWDEFIYHEMLAHVAMAEAGSKKKVLIIGGGDGGLLREVLKHKEVEKAILVDIDQKVFDLCCEHMPSVQGEIHQDMRWEFLAEDGMEYLKNASDFDVILVDSSDPEGPSQRLFEPEFFALLKNALTPDGVASLQGGTPFFYGRQLRQMYLDLEEHFPQVSPYLIPLPTYPSGQWVLTLVKNSSDSRPVDQLDFESKLRYYNSSIHQACFCLPNHIKSLFFVEEKASV